MRICVLAALACVTVFSNSLYSRDFSRSITDDGWAFKANIGCGLMNGNLSSDNGKYRYSGNSYMLDLSLGYAFNPYVIPLLDLRTSVCPGKKMAHNGATYNEDEYRFVCDTVSLGVGLRSYLNDTHFYVSESLLYHSSNYDGDDVYCGSKYGIGVNLNVGYDFRYQTELHSVYSYTTAAVTSK